MSNSINQPGYYCLDCGKFYPHTVELCQHLAHLETVRKTPPPPTLPYYPEAPAWLDTPERMWK